MWFIRWARRKPKAPKTQPWLSRKEAARVRDYRNAGNATTAYETFVKDNGASSWITCNYRGGYLFLPLLRRFENLPRDWEEVTDLALQLSELNEEQSATVREAVAAGAVPGGCYTLSITPAGYSFKDCVGDYRTVTVAEGTF